MPLGKDLLAAKLNYLQRGGRCCKKSKKSEKIRYNGKKSSPNIFFDERGYIDQILPEESNINGPDAL